MPALTRFFVDRTDEIEQLDAALKSESPEKDSFVLIHGRPGIGKSQLLAKYLRECNHQGIRIAHVDLEELTTKGYLGLIEAIVEGLGNNGFESLDETYDEILIRSPIEQGIAFAQQMPVQAAGQTQGFVFNQPVTAHQQTFVHGDVTYHNPKIENIYNIHFAEPETVTDLIQSRITRTFRSCLQTIAREQLVVILLDHWETTSDLIKSWLDDHLLKWTAELTLRKAIVAVARKELPPELEDQVGILPMAILPFSREVALEFWKKNGLEEELFASIASEIYSIPGILSLEVGSQRLKQAKR